MFSIKSLAALTAAFSLIASSSATSKPQLAVYWGQGPDQLGLAHYCQETSIDIIPIGFINKFPQQTGNSDPAVPAENFGNACYGLPLYDGTELYQQCPNVTEGIPVCQKLGKKVLLSLGGDSNSYQLTGEQAGKDFADYLWSAYGPYNADYVAAGGIRPFDGGRWNADGTTIDIDGFDFDIEIAPTDDAAGYVALINRLREHFAENPSKEYIISGAPQCFLPEANMGELITKAQFDILWIQFYNNPSCSVRTWADANAAYPAIGAIDAGFNFDSDTTSSQNWLDFVNGGASAGAQLYIGLSASTAAASASDYLSPREAKNLITAFYDAPQFGGIMLWEATAAENNVNDGVNYYDLIKSDLENCGSSPAASSTTSSVSSTAAPTTSTTTSPTTTSAAQTSTSAIPTPSTVPSVGECAFVGCYAEPLGARALTGASFIDYDLMTVELCAQNCAGYPLFGLEYKGECYCGGDFNAGTDGVAPQLVPTGECSLTCDGDAGEFCGGSAVLDVYQCGTVSSSSSSAAASSTTSAAASSTTAAESTTSDSSSSTTSEAASSSTSAAASSTTSEAASSSSSEAASSSTIAAASSTTSEAASSTTSEAASSSTSGAASSSTSAAASSTTSEAASSTTSEAASSSTSEAASSSTTEAASSVSEIASSSTSPSSSSSSAAVSSSAPSSSVIYSNSTESASPTSSTLSYSSSPVTTEQSESTTSTSASSSFPTPPYSNSTTTSQSSASSTEVVSSSTPSSSASESASPSSTAKTSGPVSLTSSSPTSTGAVSYTTSTVRETLTYTVTSCAPTVTDCPGKIGSVTTQTVDLYTTVCPVTETEGSSAALSTVGPVATSAPKSTTEFTTSTVKTTKTYTITSCAPEVTDCPGKIGSVTTETVDLYTTVCPVSATEVSPTFAPTITPASAGYTTSTVYATSVYTITSCAPTVTNCPAKIGQVTTEVVIDYTTVCPVSEASPTTVSGGAFVESSSGAQESQSTTHITTTLSSTFITYVTVSVSESTQTVQPIASTPAAIESTTSIQPEASTPVVIESTVTVQPIASTPVIASSEVAPYPTGASSSGAKAVGTGTAAGTGFPSVTLSIVKPTSTSAVSPASSSPISFTGAGNKMNLSIGGMASVALAALALMI